MKRILPKEDISRLFEYGVDFKEYTMSDMERIKGKKPNVLFGLACSIWSRVVQFKLCPVNPAALSDCIENRDPDTHLKASKILGARVLKDIYYVQGVASGPDAGEAKIAELFAAHVYPNNLHLTEIEFAMPERSPARGDDREMLRSHSDLFYRLAENAVDYGKKNGCNYLMLTVKSSYHVEIFARCGFLLEDHLAERQSIRLGLGIPMVRQL